MSDAPALALQHARRPAHPRIPARGLRRSGRARRGARAGAPARSRGRGALLRRPARRGGNVRLPDARRVRRAQRRARHDGRRPADGGGCRGADLVHSHTWYANFAGFTAKRLHGIPHVVTAHSLEPLRPWKAEQLGGGYRLSSWVERTAFEDADAVIAVSDGMRRDILRSYPSIDPGACAGRLQRHRPHRLAAERRRRDRARRSASIPTAPRWSSSDASRDRRACPTCCARRGCCRPTCSSCSARARPTPRRSWPRSPASSTCSAPSAAASSLDRPAPAAQRAHRAAHGGDRLRLPVGLRAARHREPRGDGVRRTGRRHGHRRHPRGRRRRRHRACSCPSTRPTTAPAPRSTPTRSSPTSPMRSRAWSSDPGRARAMGQAGRRRAEDHFAWDAIAAADARALRAGARRLSARSARAPSHVPGRTGGLSASR